MKYRKSLSVPTTTATKKLYTRARTIRKQFDLPTLLCTSFFRGGALISAASALSTDSTVTKTAVSNISSYFFSWIHTISQWISFSLRQDGGPMGILTLWAIAFTIVFPLTLYRKGFSFSVGYGFSVMTIAWICLQVFPLPLSSSASTTRKSIHLSRFFMDMNTHHCRIGNFLPFDPPTLFTYATLFYGFRLGTFLLVRILTVPSKARQMDEYDKNSTKKNTVLSSTKKRIDTRNDLIQRFLLALNVSLFYAFMTCPILYILRSSSTTYNPISMLGIIFTWTGVLLESIADTHKYIVKWIHGATKKYPLADHRPEIKKKNDDANENKREDIMETTFVGPTGGVYRICRHPNYLGEILFWCGLYVGGLPSYRASIVAWTCSTLGFAGILFLMLNATKRLDDKQKGVYAGQTLFEDWKKNVPFSLFPLVRS